MIDRVCCPVRYVRSEARDAGGLGDALVERARANRVLRSSEGSADIDLRTRHGQTVTGPTDRARCASGMSYRVVGPWADGTSWPRRRYTPSASACPPSGSAARARAVTPPGALSAPSDAVEEARHTAAYGHHQGARRRLPREQSHSGQNDVRRLLADGARRPRTGPPFDPTCRQSAPSRLSAVLTRRARSRCWRLSAARPRRTSQGR